MINSTSGGFTMIKSSPNARLRRIHGELIIGKRVLGELIIVAASR